ncbi:MAG TPA: hypothetical protein VMS88_07675 [Terriglobales bacterium]|nr:hypothetical protein [Terriglobales bacterium]
MAVPLAADSRVTMNDSPEGLEIVMPAPRNWLVIGFLSVWLMGWAAGETFAVRGLLGPAPLPARAFLAVWLAFWTLGGATALGAVAWMLAGHERVRLRSDALTVRYEVLGIGRVRAYALDSISKLRSLSAPALAAMTLPGTPPPLAEPAPSLQQIGAVLAITGLRGGGIAFESRGRPVRLGLALDAAEAQQVLTQLRARHSFA